MPKAKVKHVCHDFVSLDVDGEEVDLPVRLAPGHIMGSYVEYLHMRPTPNTLVLGYLIEDEDCRHPLDDCDGMGKIYSAHRHAGRPDHYAMQQALGLNQYWDPDLDHELVEPEARRLHPDVRWDAANVGWPEIRPYIVEAWNKLREDGVIGDPLAVTLDCYEHGGQHWSLSGGGTQCRWDTSNGAGIWVPDECCLEHIRSKALDIVLGIKTEWAGSQAVATLADGTTIERALWKEMLADLQARLGDEATSAAVRRAEREVAEECAQQALDEYNKWLAGDCYGVVVCSYSRHGPEDAFELLESDECWGHIGDEWAKEAMKESAEGTAKHLREQEGESV